MRTLLGKNSRDFFEHNGLVNVTLKQCFERFREEDNDVYITPTCEAELYNVKTKQIKKILMYIVLCQMHVTTGFFSTGRNIAYSLGNHRNYTKSGIMKKICIIYIQQIFC